GHPFEDIFYIHCYKFAAYPVDESVAVVVVNIAAQGEPVGQGIRRYSPSFCHGRNHGSVSIVANQPLENQLQSPHSACIISKEWIQEWYPSNFADVELLETGSFYRSICLFRYRRRRGRIFCYNHAFGLFAGQK